METHRLKQRIVGAVVLVALAVIFIPMILDGGNSELPILTSNIPSQPGEIRELRDLQIKRPAPLVAPEPPRAIPIDEHSPTYDEPAVEPEKLEEPKPGTEHKGNSAIAWAVQVGSFAKRDNAMGLRDKLRKKGFTAFVERVSGTKLAIYRVRIGPFVRKSDAEAAKEKLATSLQQKGLVLSHP